MRHYLSFAVLVAGLAFAPLTACTPVPTVPAAGTTVDASFWKDYHPVAKKGMKWTYVETLVNGDKKTTGDRTEEVVDVQGDVATVKTTGHSAYTPDVALDDTATRSATYTPTTDGETPAVYKSEGAADVTVPYKSFKGAAKLSLVASGALQSMSVYLVPGIGLVKLEMTSSVSGQTASYTEELKDFVSP